MAATTDSKNLKKFILFIRATPTTEDPASLSRPSPETSALLERMMHFTTELVNKGILVDADGLLPSSVSSARISGFSSSEDPDNKQPVTVTRGPFDHTTLVSGYFVIKAADLDEAIGWAKKMPCTKGEEVVEVREVNTLADFGENVPESVKEGKVELKKRFEEAAGAEGSE